MLLAFVALVLVSVHAGGALAVAALTEAPVAPHRFHVEGWTGMTHSYSTIADQLMLALSQRNDAEIASFKQMPLFDARWKDLVHKNVLYDEETGRALRNLTARRVGGSSSAAAAHDNRTSTLRVSINFEPSSTMRTFVLATTECGNWDARALAGSTPFSAEALARSNLHVLTPSLWSMAGFLRAGAPLHRLSILPHGVAAAFAPRPLRARAAYRRRFQMAGRFVVLHVSSLTRNKGIDSLLLCFRDFFEQAVDALQPVPLLILKGSTLHNSLVHLQEAMRRLEPGGQAGAVGDSGGGNLNGKLHQMFVQGDIRYTGDDFSVEAMASLYAASDMYASPYHAEGFNVPVLEAAASGLPVVATAGGSTADFTSDAFRIAIRSRLTAFWSEPGRPMFELLPNETDLLAHFNSIYDSRAAPDGLAARARVAGPAHASGLHWRHIAARLMDIVHSTPLPSSQDVHTHWPPQRVRRTSPRARRWLVAGASPLLAAGCRGWERFDDDGEEAAEQTDMIVVHGIDKLVSAVVGRELSGRPPLEVARSMAAVALLLDWHTVLRAGGALVIFGNTTDIGDDLLTAAGFEPLPPALRKAAAHGVHGGIAVNIFGLGGESVAASVLAKLVKEYRGCIDGAAHNRVGDE